MYTGLLIFFGTGLLDDFSWPALLVFAALGITFGMKIRDEEKFLTQRFGEAYLNYKSRTFRMIPYVF